MVRTDDIWSLVLRNEEWRKDCINLIASENVQSMECRRIQNNDFMGRYAEGHPGERYYQGTMYIDEIESIAEREAKELFGARLVDVRPISGNNANTAIALGFLRGGDTVIVNSTPAGGHISHNNIGVFGRRIQVRGQSLTLGKDNSINLYFFPTTEDGYHMDVEKAKELIDEVKPRMLVLGKSLFLFREPVRELYEFVKDREIPILYDGAHVLGLIAGGEFQNPLQEGATWLTGSTHKTFFGPQRGIILSNLQNEEEVKKYWLPADRGVFPGSSSNHHLHTLPSLIVAIREMKAYGKEYAKNVIANAKALAKAMDELGLKVEGKEFGYTETHQVAVNVVEYGGGRGVALLLEKNNIIVNYNMLPWDKDPKNPSGIRIGVQEMTRYGMGEKEMQKIAEFIKAILSGKDMKKEVIAFRRNFVEVKYA